MSTVRDMPDSEYHALPSLSSTGAKILLEPGGPAKFKAYIESPPPPSPVFDFGSLVHKLVLGKGSDVVLIEADSWRTKAAKEARDQAHAEGKIPALEAEHRRATKMQTRLFRHPYVRDLFAQGGESELSAFATDPVTGVDLRARFDRVVERDGKLIIIDYKTAMDASPHGFERAAAKFKYHVQDAFYRKVAKLAGLHDEPEFIFIAQEKVPPYLPAVYQYDDLAIAEARSQVDTAIRMFADCTQRDDWRGYDDGLQTMALPTWAWDEVEDMEIGA